MERKIRHTPLFLFPKFCVESCQKHKLYNNYLYTIYIHYMFLAAFDTKFFKNENGGVPNFPFHFYNNIYIIGTEN